MAIISAIGRKSPYIRFLYFSIYSLLILGTLTMVYPFLLMVSGSTKSAVDIKYFDVVPQFLYDNLWLYRKHTEGLFNEKIGSYNRSYGKNSTSFEQVMLPENVNSKLSEKFVEYIKNSNMADYRYTIGYLEAPRSRTMPLNLRNFKSWLQNKFGSDINKLNTQCDTEFISWNDIHVRREEWILRRDKPVDTPFGNALIEFKKTVPIGLRYYFSLEGFFRKDYIINEYGLDIANYNEKNGTAFQSYANVQLPRRFPADAAKQQQKDWEYFVRELIGIQFIQVDKNVTGLYRNFLKAKQLNIQTLNKNYGTSYNNFDEIQLLKHDRSAGMAVTDWEDFILGWKDDATGKFYALPLDAITLHDNTFAFQDYLISEYESIEKINTNLGTSYKALAGIMMPQADMQYAYFQKNQTSIKKEFMIRNYITVSNYLIFHGRGIFNTVIYCALAVLSALIINPLAAYAMSRYQLPSTYKILLLLLCTMAFPPMVTAIPNFLMLRHLGLLNTFGALILPGMANGYLIFLLKGFFDSHPRELYESAAIDGAGEWVMFWNLTMSLSKPVLAVVALQAFNIAYANFMFAFVVCQDESMWTLMVWLYQLQQKSGQAVMYASLIIAAVPTFMIFLFCQNLIMRGIVVPSEK